MPAAGFELFDLAREVWPVVGGDGEFGHLAQQRSEVAQAADSFPGGAVQQGDVLTGATEQIGLLDLLQRHVASIPVSGQLLVDRAESPLHARAAQEELPDLFDVTGLVGDSP